MYIGILRIIYDIITEFNKIYDFVELSSVLSVLPLQKVDETYYKYY